MREIEPLGFTFLNPSERVPFYSQKGPSCFSCGTIPINHLLSFSNKRSVTNMTSTHEWFTCCDLRMRMKKRWENLTCMSCASKTTNYDTWEHLGCSCQEVAMEVDVTSSSLEVRISFCEGLLFKGEVRGCNTLNIQRINVF